MKSQVLLLGTIISEETQQAFIDKGIRPAPAGIVMNYIIDGLQQLDYIEKIDVIGSPRISAFPRTSIKAVKNEKWEKGKTSFITCGFHNIIGYGFAERENNIVKEVKKWAKMPGHSKIILIYSVHSPFLRAALEAKKINDKIKVGLIVADLPQFMSRYNAVTRVLKQVDKVRTSRLITCVDKYLLYTRYMAQFFNISQDKWIVFEGLIDTNKIKMNSDHNIKPDRICIYAGSLDPRYAIDTLIEAFEKADVSAKLHIYGDPVAAERLKPLLEKSNKTRYIGFVSSDEMFQIMKNASLLINPRPSTLELAKYSCPSKTFEYMATGTPVLMTRLPGVPDEYYQHMYIVDDESVQGFKNKIEEILKTDEHILREKGKDAQRFLLEYKTSEKQMDRVMRFVLGK